MVLGLPLFQDQFDNLLQLEERGGAKVLDIGSFNRGIFLQGLQEVLHNGANKFNMQKLSRPFHEATGQGRLLDRVRHETQRGC